MVVAVMGDQTQHLLWDLPEETDLQTRAAVVVDTDCIRFQVLEILVETAAPAS